MDLNSPDTWRWIWLGAAVVMTAGELTTAGAFFFMPFAIGAVIAAAAAFAGASLGIEWLLFVATSAAAFAVLFPLGRRLDRRGSPEAIGAGRWVGREGVVLEEITGGVGGTGLVRLEREEWRAESFSGTAIKPGASVLVLRVHGTRLIVAPTSEGEG